MRDSLATAIFLREASSGNPIQIHGDGKQTRCFTHIEDICEGILCVMENDDFSGTINISDDREISVNQLAELTLQVVGKNTEIIYTREREGQIFRSSIDNSLLREIP